MQFSELGLAEALLRALNELDYSKATPIQQQAIPRVLEGRDLLAAAQTGTGKTAAFALPMLQRLQSGQSGKAVRALVVVPTRELAAQVGESFRAYARHVPLRFAVVFGGVGINPQIDRLRRGVDVLVATPGRLLDHLQQGTVDLSRVETLVLDEADRMLDMGFIHDIRRLLKVLPKQRQTLLFSATFSKEIRALAQHFLHDPVSVDVTPRNTAAESVEQRVHPVDKSRKAALLTHLIKDGNWYQVLVFARTKHGANRLTEKLVRGGITAAAIHGNKSQNARTRALAQFKEGTIQALVATDIAARGIDIELLPHVVNFELPNVPEDYVHRIGRTGRAGSNGEAVSLVSHDERPYLKQIQRLLKREIPSSVVDGFAPGSPLLPGETAAPQADTRRPPKRGNRAPKRPGKASARPDWGRQARSQKSAEHRAGKSRKVH